MPPVVDAAPIVDVEIVDAVVAETPASPAVDDAAWVRTPATFVRSPRETEPMANAVAKKVSSAVCRALEHADFAAFEKATTADFEGRLWGDSPTATQRVGLVDRTQWVSTTSVERSLFVTGLKALQQRFAAVERCKVKVWRFFWAEPGRDWAKARLHLRVSGVDAQGRRIEYRSDPTVELAADPWRLRRLDLGSAVQIATAAPLFVDVSRSVGFDLRRAQETEDAIRHRIDGGQIETIGGLGVVDWNTDGRDDVMVWNQRRTLQVFVNDGTGGFDRVVNPIPSSAVGLAHLYVDLDGDGRAELVSSEVSVCQNETGEFGLFRGTRDGKLVPVRTLRFPTTCGDHRRLTYQHIATADVDGDGDLDLFFSGFSNAYSKMESHNVFLADDGQPNLLFINQGRLRFREVAQAQGVAGNDFSYGAAFFDYEDDGDPDLYVVNDYGRNALYLNDGRGRFKVAPPSPLTANGQSMGVTVADLDGDLKLDVYVSNMFSYAGNRIVPLFESKLQAPTYTDLMALAHGNTLYRGSGGGLYDEVATEMGVHRAGWAWGHAFFDADNDGAFDLYVQNGNTSHSDARAPDY